MWCRRMWRQNAASLSHVALGSAGIAICGVKTWHHLRMRVSGGRAASPDVASNRASRAHVAPLGGIAGAVPCRVHSDGLTWRHRTLRQNVASVAHAVSGGCLASQVWRQMGRHVPMWCQAVRWHCWNCTRVYSNGLTWRHRTWRQNVASLAHASGTINLRGVARGGVNTWRQYVASEGPALPDFGTCAHACMCMYRYLQMYVCMHERTCALMCVCMHLSVYVRVYFRMHAMHVCMHACMHGCTHACMHACTHVQIHAHPQSAIPSAPAA